MILSGFIEGKSDETLIKSLDKTKLVQRDVQYKTKTGVKTRKQWVKATDDEPANKQPKQQDDEADDKSKKQSTSADFPWDGTDDPKKSIMEYLASGKKKEKLMEDTHNKGITWNRCDTNPNIDWMRCSMAIQAHLKNSKPSKPIDQAEKKPATPKSTENKVAQGNSQPNAKTEQKDAKTAVKELSSEIGNNKLVEAAKANGITWNENPNKGINIMRAKMAVQAAYDSDPSIIDTLKGSSTKATQPVSNKKVAELTDLLGKVTDKATVASKKSTKKPDILDGITETSKSRYEEKTFGDVLSKAKPEDLRNYRTLGMCAGDKESAEYLSDLYNKYSEQMIKLNRQSVTPVRYDVYDNDPIRNKLQGTVNSSVVSVVKQSVVGVRKRAQSRATVAKLFEIHWRNPSGFDDGEIDDIKKRSGGSSDLENNRKTAATKKEGGEYVLMKQTLDKLAGHPDFKDTAPEYKELVERFEHGTMTDPEIQTLVSNYCQSKKKEKVNDYIAKTLQDRNAVHEARIKHLESQIKSREAEYDMLKKVVDNGDWTAFKNKTKGYFGQHSSYDDYLDFIDDRVSWKSSTWGNTRKEVAEHQMQYIKEDIERNKEVIKDRKNSIEHNKEVIKTTKVNPDKLEDAVDAFNSMMDSKYIDINANLIHTKRVSDELTRQYFCTTKDFVEEYPVLSKKNIDILDGGDNDAITNLALHAGSFKPSLAKQGDVTKALQKSMSERQAFLYAYGGVKSINNSKGYAEDNEVRCKVSKASAQKTKEISDRIARDWDMQNHGGMRYKIKGVYEVSGLALDADFQQIKQANLKKCGNHKVGGKSCGSDMFYHGTGSMATSLILGHSGEFKLVKAKVGRMLGDGIYLADKSSKSGQYISDSGYSRSGIEGSLMVVEASLGYTKEVRGAAHGCDSVFAGKNQGLLNSEWCVHNPKAVIPRYLVHMEIR